MSNAPVIEFVDVAEAKQLMRRARIRLWITDGALGLAASSMVISGILTLGLHPGVTDIGWWMIGGGLAIVALAALIYPAE